MKKLLLFVALVGCSDQDNKASIIAKGQNPELSCHTTRVEHVGKLVDVAICKLYNKETKTYIDFITAVSDDHPFQAFNLKTTTQVKAEEAAKAAAAAQGSNATVQK